MNESKKRKFLYQNFSLNGPKILFSLSLCYIIHGRIHLLAISKLKQRIQNTKHTLQRESEKYSKQKTNKIDSFVLRFIINQWYFFCNVRVCVCDKNFCFQKFQIKKNHCLLYQCHSFNDIFFISSNIKLCYHHPHHYQRKSIHDINQSINNYNIYIDIRGVKKRKINYSITNQFFFQISKNKSPLKENNYVGYV